MAILGLIDSTTGQEVADADTLYGSPDISELDLEIDLDTDLTAGNANIVDATGYSATRNLFIRIIGTIAENTTITLPAVGANKRNITIKDSAGNGLSSPDYTLNIIPDGSDSIDSDDPSLPAKGAYELTYDYEAITFYEYEAGTKWETR